MTRLTDLGLLHPEFGRLEALMQDILLSSLDRRILEGESPPARNA